MNKLCTFFMRKQCRLEMCTDVKSKTLYLGYTDYSTISMSKSAICSIFYFGVEEISLHFD